MKENNIIIFIAAICLLSVFFLAYGAQGNYLAIIGTSVLDGWATQAGVSVSLRIGTVTCSQSFNVSTSGTVIVARDSCFDDKARGLNVSLANMTSGWQVNFSAYGTSYPDGWSEPEPNSTQAGTTKFEYFEVTINQTVPNSSYMISFNMSQASLEGVDPENVTLLMYNDTSTLWVNLTTEVIDGTSDFAQFFSIAPHFSKFLMGQKVAGTGAGGGSGDAGGGAPQTGTPSGGGGGGAKPAEEKKEKVEEAPQPIRIPGNYFDVSVNIPERYRTLKMGDELVAEISIINIRKLGLMSVTIEYAIEDNEGRVLWSQIETKAVENEITFLKEVDLPELLPGYHMFKVRVTFEKDVALAGYPFNVVQEAEERVPATSRSWIDTLYIPLLFIIVIGMLYLILFVRKRMPEKIRGIKAHNERNEKSGIVKKKMEKPAKTSAKQKIKETAHDYWDEMQKFVRR